ncbi:MAG: hypothetical protein RL538_824, partial [Candidatus Parcubacteria bacterium]
ITVTNNTGSKQIVYATVNEVAVDEGGKIMEFVSPAMSDRTDTVTSWVEITRGRLEFEPGETKTVPLTIRVHPQAKPGNYHVFIGFGQASKRHVAESAAMSGNVEGTIVKVAIDEKTSEILRISSFLVDRFVFSESNRTIEIELENTGQNDAVPQGEIIFYNSRGEEVGSLPVAGDGLVVPPGEKKMMTATVPFHESLGRYKANLVLRYGADQKAAVFDTTQFFMVPLPVLIAVLIIIVLFSLGVTYLLRRAFYDELHEDDDGNTLPLYVRNDREHDTKDHDIDLKKV